VVLDNGSSNCSKRTQAWVNRQKRIRLMLISTLACRLDRIEIWSGILTSKTVRRASSDEEKSRLQNSCAISKPIIKRLGRLKGPIGGIHSRHDKSTHLHNAARANLADGLKRLHVSLEIGVFSFLSLEPVNLPGSRHPNVLNACQSAKEFTTKTQHG